MEMKRKFKGCLIGSALGDAVGELAFKYQTEEKLRVKLEERDRLRYTDDTAMAIGLAESLIENEGEIDQEKIGDTFRKNYREEPRRGYGQGPPQIFRMMERGEMGYVEAASTLFDGEGSKGNGSAMRIAPIGIFFSKDDHIYEKAGKTAEVTHTHPLGKDGAALLALAVGKAAVSDKITSVDFVGKLAERAETQEFTGSLSRVGELLENDLDREKAAEELGTSVLIERSVPYAIFSFLKDPNSYEKGLMNAIMVPGDRDTIGAMTGGISGAFLGLDALPEMWVNKLENIDYLERLASQLHTIFKERWG